jgi:hypothetical protein
MATDLKLNGGIEATGYSGGPVAGTTFTGTTFTGTTFTGTTFTGTTFEGTTFEGTTFEGAKIKTTAEGGIAVKMTNKTGAESVKGSIVSLSTETDNAFALAAIDASGVVGVVYESGVANGAECWVVVKGIAETLFTNNITHGMYARAPIDADTDEVAGRAVGAAIPAATFNTDAYLARFGFVMESKAAGALAKVLLD